MILLFRQLSLSSAYSDKLCKALAPNGKYQPIGAYRRWFQNSHMESQYNDSYWMWNREKEWQFRLTFDNNNWPIDVELVSNSLVNSINTSIVNRFAPKWTTKSNGKQFYESYYCEVYYEYEQNETVTTYCLRPPADQLRKNAQFMANSLIISPFPDKKTIYTIIVDRENVVPKHIKYYYLDSDRIYIYDRCRRQGCRLLKIFQTLNQIMFRFVDAIVDYDYGTKRQGYVLFFTYNSQPYYCFATLTELSRECKSFNMLKRLASYCTNIWLSNASNTTTTTVSISSTVLSTSSAESTNWTTSDTTITTTLVVDDNNDTNTNRSSTYLWFYVIIIVIYEPPKPSDDNKLDKIQSRVPSEIRAKVGQMDTDWSLHVDNISTESIKSKMS
ncbi:uncharacterized protein LOC128956494 [Oppia nitens]|uniref:uncharacterized protein LOC128956494 n=1 Tax=Oppia nitens TaxID=1686743 RepID=UPI0023DB9D5E|nr:uncharacterized protein LOC128956494 [Oppia nitens]